MQAEAEAEDLCLTLQPLLQQLHQGGGEGDGAGGTWHRDCTDLLFATLAALARLYRNEPLPADLSRQVGGRECRNATGVDEG